MAGQQWTRSACDAIAILALVSGLTTTFRAAPERDERSQVDHDKAAALRARGLELGYNHDYPQAFDAFKEAIAADPDDATAYRLLAATAWVRLLFEQGAITVEDYLGQTRATLPRRPPAADLAGIFTDSLNRAIALTDKRLRERPDDADAHYQAGAAYGFLASYTATVDGRVLDSLKSARRAYREHERTLALDPSRKDAGLVVGMYRYIVSTLSAPLRLAAYLAGFGGDRARGLRMIEDAARYPSDVQTNAMFMLVLFYNREERFDEALQMIGELQQRYPRNRLLWLEAGNTALRAGRAVDARAAIEDGLARLAADTRPRAPGEDARWQYAYGAALVALHDTSRARTSLQAALARATRDWVRGRTQKELGKLADLEGDRARAVTAYRDAERLCGADRDEVCTKDLKALIKQGFPTGASR
jgi:tetratricopeptide (TPR) repeat protein